MMGTPFIHGSGENLRPLATVCLGRCFGILISCTLVDAGWPLCRDEDDGCWSLEYGNHIQCRYMAVTVNGSGGRCCFVYVY